MTVPDPYACRWCGCHVTWDDDVSAPRQPAEHYACRKAQRLLEANSDHQGEPVTRPAASPGEQLAIPSHPEAALAAIEDRAVSLGTAIRQVIATEESWRDVAEVLGERYLDALADAGLVPVPAGQPPVDARVRAVVDAGRAWANGGSLHGPATLALIDAIDALDAEPAPEPAPAADGPWKVVDLKWADIWPWGVIATYGTIVARTESEAAAALLGAADDTDTYHDDDRTVIDWHDTRDALARATRGEWN